MSHLRNMFGSGNKNNASGYQVFEDDSSELVDDAVESSPTPTPSEEPAPQATTVTSDSSSEEDSSSDDDDSSSDSSDLRPPSGEEEQSSNNNTSSSEDDLEQGKPADDPSDTIDAEVEVVQSPPSFKGMEEDEEEEKQQESSMRSRDPEAKYSGEGGEETPTREIMSGADESDDPPPTTTAAAAAEAEEKTSVSKDAVPPVRKQDKVDEAPEDACLSNRRVQFGFAAAIAGVFVIGFLAVGLAARNNKPSSVDPPTFAPTLSLDPSAMPSFAPNPISPDDAALLSLWESVVGDSIYEEGTSFNEAAQWMLFRDPSRPEESPVEDDEEDDAGGETRFLQDGDRDYNDAELASIQRFLLTNLWFATTNNGRQEWLSCNPDEASGYEEEDCIYQKVIRRIPEGLQYTQIPWTRWLSGADECDWAGITCRTTSSGRRAVVGIDLGGQRLVATMEDLVEIMKLPELKTLALAYNEIFGQLDLALETLEVLDFTENLLTGPVIKLGGLSSLTLEGNSLSGTVPRELFEFNTPLQHLNLGGNKLEGTIPAEASFALQLTSLQLHANQLTGSIPPELGQLPLRSLRVHENQLEGSIPLDVINVNWLETLEELWVYGNELGGSIPDVLGSASRMLDLRLSENNLVGSIPRSLSDLDRLFRLELADNRLTGTISVTVTSQLTNLEILDLSKNELRGSILLDNRLSKLETLKVELNQFTGPVPSLLCGIDSLEELSADCLPPTNPPNECACCTECCSRSTGTCSDQNVSPLPPVPGSAPVQAPSTNSEVEEVQRWARQTFGSSIDQGSGTPHGLASLWIARADTLGVSIDDTTFLQRYVLAHFFFTTRLWKSCNAGSTLSCLFDEMTIAEDGAVSITPVPATRWLASASECEWAGVSCSSGTVVGIELNGQEIGGSLPEELFRLNTLRVLSLAFNEIGGTIPTQVGSLPRLTTLRLSNNQLQGTIPPELGRASFLTTAQFEGNSLSGVMPDDVCDLGTLTTLTVDSNTVACDCCTSR